MVEGALGQLIEGVLAESPEALVDALGELGEGRLTRATKDIAFAEGRAWTRGGAVVRASGIFKLMERPRPA